MNKDFNHTLPYQPSIRGACIEKDLGDALLFQCSTLALGLVEEGIWVWAPEASQSESLDSSVDSSVYRYICTP